MTSAIRQVLHTLAVMSPLLTEFLYLVIPGIVRVAERLDLPVVVRRHAVDCLGRITRDMHVSGAWHNDVDFVAVKLMWHCLGAEFSSRIVLPLSRVLDDASSTTSPPELKTAVLDTLCFVLRQLKGDYIVFVPLIRKVGVA